MPYTRERIDFRATSWTCNAKLFMPRRMSVSRPPATPAPPKELVSLPRLRFDNSCRQPGRDQSRDTHASLPRKLDLNCRRRSTPNAIPYRGDQHLGESVADPDLPPPAIDLPGANFRSNSYEGCRPFVLIPVERRRRPSATVSPVPSQRSTRRAQRVTTADVTRHRMRCFSWPRSRYLPLSPAAADCPT